MSLRPQQVLELEEQIGRIRNVGFCAIKLNGDGQIDAIDIVSDTGRAAQRIVRDVEIIFRRHGVEIDHRKIGVAQLEDPRRLAAAARRLEAAADPVEDEPGQVAARGDEPQGVEPPHLAVLEQVDEAERLRLAAVHSTTRDGSFRVEVELTLGAFEGLPGRAEGPAQDETGCIALVARASLEAVRNLLQPGYEAQLREARVVEMGGLPMVAVTVDFSDGREILRLAGACLQRGSLYDTAVYATLDAINRRLGRARFRRLMALGEAPDHEGPSARAMSA